MSIFGGGGSGSGGGGSYAPPPPPLTGALPNIQGYTGSVVNATPAVVAATTPTTDGVPQQPSDSPSPVPPETVDILGQSRGKSLLGL